MRKAGSVHVIVRDIEWETDDNEVPKNEVPDIVVVPLEMADMDCEERIHEVVMEHLSDNYGRLVNSYDLGWKS
jgi:hypothetical protein